MSGQERLFKSIEGITRKHKAASDCTASDWQQFNFQSKGTLQIPPLNQQTFLNVYNKVYTSKKKNLEIKSLQRKYTFARALSDLDLTDEPKYMHPVTKHFLSECLALRP